MNGLHLLWIIPVSMILGSAFTVLLACAAVSGLSKGE